jgi:RND superfamily putative drug exporter
MRRGITEKLAQACAAHPKRTLATWGITIALALGLVAGALHGLSSNAHVNGTPESAKAANLLAQAFPNEARAQAVSDVIVVRSASHTVNDRAFKAFVAGLAAKVQATGKVAGLHSYLNGGAPVSANGHATLIQLEITSDAAAKPVVSVVEAAGRTPGFGAAITGDHSVGSDFNTLSQHDLEHGELAFGLPAALIVLILVFGALVAGLVPVLMALVSILVGLGIVALLSLAFDLSVFTVNMLTGMGLALGIDYSLFVISRYREERTRGLAERNAIGAAGATASRAVLFSGSTFVVALFGMLLVPTSIMRSLAAGAIIVGVVSVAAALTLLPALLSLLGDRIDRLRVPILGRNLGSTEGSESRFWRRTVTTVQRHPVIGLTLGVGVMLVAAIPIFGLHIGQSGVTTLPSNMPSRVGYTALQQEFPASNPYPVEVVTQGGGPTVETSLESLAHKLAADPRFGTGAVRTGLDGIHVLSVPIRGDAVGSAAVSAVRDLRANLAPAALDRTGARVYIGGKTAETADYFDAVTNPTPYVLAFVLGLSLIVLTVAFRSIVVALLSIALNLLSVAAAYGLLTLVFLRGVGSGLFGFQHVHTVDAWVPLFLFSVLFALSMDYQVFLMSRIKERYDLTRSTHDAVATGISSTAKIITGAALIIIIVFSGFASGELVMFQQMGFGVAIALLLDATLIRSLVLPSALTLLGDRTWYLPRWLNWLPHFEIEPAAGTAPA